MNSFLRNYKKVDEKDLNNSSYINLKGPEEDDLENEDEDESEEDEDFDMFEFEGLL